MLVEQDTQHPVGRDQPQEPPVGGDHGQAAFVAVHHSPGGALLVGIRRDLRRVGVHDVLDAGVRVGGQKALDRDQADEPPRLENDDILGAPKLAPDELPPDLADALVAPSHRDALGRVLRRDAQQTVRLGQGSRCLQGSHLCVLVGRHSAWPAGRSRGGSSAVHGQSNVKPPLASRSIAPAYGRRLHLRPSARCYEKLALPISPGFTFLPHTEPGRSRVLPIASDPRAPAPDEVGRAYHARDASVSADTQRALARDDRQASRMG